MTRSILTCFHNYTGFGGEFYEPILKFYLQQMEKYKDEYDKIYLIDSNWNISPATHHLPDNVVVIKVSPHFRYYDAYKEALDFIKEDSVLFLDNDVVIYSEGKIEETFNMIEGYDMANLKFLHDVVSIYASIGEYKTDKLNGKNKFCPFWFATRRELLMKYLDVNWGSDMPYCETLGHLTEKMLEDGVKPYEWEEDYGKFLFGEDERKGKDLGYYHIQAGSTPAYLLAAKHYNHEQTYWEYLKNQPRAELLRHCAWYHYMELSTSEEPAMVWEIIKDCDILQPDWVNYMNKFKKFHGLV